MGRGSKEGSGQKTQGERQQLQKKDTESLLRGDWGYSPSLARLPTLGRTPQRATRNNTEPLRSPFPASQPTRPRQQAPSRVPGFGPTSEQQWRSEHLSRKRHPFHITSLLSNGAARHVRHASHMLVLPFPARGFNNLYKRRGNRSSEKCQTSMSTVFPTA